METVTERLITVLKALDKLQITLAKIGQKEYSLDFEEMRDSAIQRFEFSMDTFWKYLNAYLQDVQGVHFEGVSSPRSTFKAALQSNVLKKDEFDKCIGMVEDRNRTSHTYNEETAQEIFERVPEYYLLMVNLINRFK